VAAVRWRIPIVTGIGHEVDTSIADLVADHHAHTPTEAAQVVTAHWKVVKDSLAMAGTRLRRGLRNVVQDSNQRLVAIRRHEFFRRPTDRINQLRQFLDDRQRSLQFAAGESIRAAMTKTSRLQAKLADRHPRHLVDLKRQTLGDLSNRLALAMHGDLHRRSQQMNLLQRNLDSLSPQAVLKRGYTITTKKKNAAIVRASAELREGDRIVTQFADGTAESIVEDQKQLPLFE
jgi:exodeoxyribonuclease VII large subunit